MQAVAILKDLNLEPNAILEDPINVRLLTSLYNFSKALQFYGYQVPIYSDASLLKLNDMDVARKIQVAEYFDFWRGCITPQAGEIAPARVTVEKEVSFAKRALDKFGFHVHENFWKTLEQDQIVEIYGHDMIQIYRSISFFKFCSYSLLDISVFEWFVLWERPKRATEVMMNITMDTLERFIPLQSANSVPIHAMRETVDTGLTTFFKPRAFLVEFKNIGCTFDRPEEGTPRGFICTSKAEIIADGEEAKNIQFV